MKTTTLWQKDHEFESHMENNSIKLDGNRLNGFSPKALLLSGLAACSGIDVVDILNKMKVSFSDFGIDCEAEQTETNPKVFTDITLHYKLHTDQANYDKIKKAVDLSLQKYCGVAAMLRKNSEIKYEIIIH